MARRPTGLLLLALALGCGGTEVPPPPSDEVLVHVGAVILAHVETPVVILEEENGPRALPIWIGRAEALSIASQISRQPPPRPNFHDMAQRLLQQLEADVERVVVTQLRNGTYYAILHLRANERHIEIDVRPSDGIAMALRTEAPILVRASVFEEAGEVLRGQDPEDPGRPIELPIPDPQREESDRQLRV